MKKYTTTQQNLLYALELAIDTNLEAIDKTYEQERRTLPQKVQRKIARDFMIAFKDNESVLDVIAQTPPEVTKLHTSYCINSDVAKCICGNSMLSDRNSSPQRQKGFYLL